MNKINRQELAKAIHKIAVAKGFWDEKHAQEHYLMLVITELSEAVEAYRNQRRADLRSYHKGIKQTESYEGKTCHYYGSEMASIIAFEEYIKYSLEDKLSDAYIRLLDLAEGFGYETSERDNKNGYPLFREDLLDSIYYLIVKIVNEFRATDQEAKPDAGYVLNYLEDLADKMGIDLLWYIQEKMRYNSTRSYLHGKIF